MTDGGIWPEMVGYPHFLLIIFLILSIFLDYDILLLESSELSHYKSARKERNT